MDFETVAGNRTLFLKWDNIRRQREKRSIHQIQENRSFYISHQENNIQEQIKWRNHYEGGKRLANIREYKAKIEAENHAHENKI
jgi:hypothetical protein